MNTVDKAKTESAGSAPAIPPAVLETVHQVWNTETGERVEAGPHPDEPNCLEVRHLDRDGKSLAAIKVPTALAKLVARAVTRAARDLEEDEAIA